MNIKYKKSVLSIILRTLVIVAACITGGTLLYIVGYILINGIPHLSPELFSWEYNSENLSMLPSIINTLIITALSLIIAVPLGIFFQRYILLNMLKEAISLWALSELLPKPFRAYLP